MGLKQNSINLKYIVLLSCMFLINISKGQVGTYDDTIYYETDDANVENQVDNSDDYSESDYDIQIEEVEASTDKKPKEVFHRSPIESQQDFENEPLPSNPKLKKIANKYNKFKQKEELTKKEFKREDKSKRRKRKRNEGIFLSQNIFYAIAILMALGLIGYLIFSWGKVKNMKLEKIRTSIYDLTEDTDIEKIDKTELELALDKALKIKDYRLCVRIHYLILIKKLTDSKVIKWRKQKTNLDYYIEMDENPHKQGFMDLTLDYEKIWYGEFEISKVVYPLIAQKFNKYFIKSSLNE